MAYSDNFPATRPVFMADFANGGKIDPRATFSRASTANVWDGSKHLSSENLLTHSNDISTAYGKNGLTETGGQTAPDGGTDAYKLTEDSATGFHRIYYAENVLSAGLLTVSCYVKYIGRQWVYIRLRDSGASYRHVWFDVQNGIKGTEETNMTGTISASGGGYYKLTATVSSVHASSADVRIGGANADGNTQYAGSGSDAFAVWGIQASTTGETVLNETDGQIHRAYAPSLVSKSNNIGRFDHTTDGQSVAKGILVEGQSTNLVSYSEDLSNGAWVKVRSSITTAAAIAPDGTLTANQLTVDGTADSTHHTYIEYTTGGATPQTASVYAKANGLNYLIMRLPSNYGAFTDGYVEFNLENGTVGTNFGGLTSSSIESCGNGWYRCSITSTALTNTTCRLVLYASVDGSFTSDGNNYNSLLLWGVQTEANQSFASSYIKSNSGSTTTRAAESLSVATADIGYTGGPVSIVADGDSSSDYGVLALMRDSSGSGDVAYLYANPNSTNKAEVSANGVSSTATATAGTGASALALDTNRLAACRAGGTVTSDTSTALPVLNELQIGSLNGAYVFLNGHCKRVAIYNEALSDANLQSLTS